MGQAYLVRRGGGNLLNFSVVGGTEQPAAPKENTIWVNTAEITSWSISPFDIEDVAEDLYTGDIGVQTGYYLKADGSTTAQSVWRIEGPFHLPNGTKSITVATGSTSSTYPNHVFYDSSGAVISGATRATGINTYAVPDGAVSVKLSLHTSDTPSLTAVHPIEAEEGAVRILTGASFDLKFNALKKESLIVAPIRGLIYKDGSWVSVDIKVYQDGAWHSAMLSPIKDGVLAQEMQVRGGSWASGDDYSSNNPALTQEAGYVKFAGTKTGYGMAYIENVDLTGMSELVIEGTFTPKDYVRLCVWSQLGTYLGSYVVAYAKITETGARIDLSASSLEGAHIIGFTSQASYVQQITNFYLR